ncbi:MAG: HEAT repeat domain-containing protein [Bacillota bacterium]
MNLSHFWILIAFLFLGQLLLLFLLAWRKRQSNKKDAAIEQQYNALTEPFSSYMMDPSDERFIEELKVAPYRLVVLERLLNHYVSVTKAGADSPAISRLSEKFLSQRYIKQLKRGSWAMRMNTLYFIEDFRMASLVPLLKEKLAKSSRLDQETQQLIRTLASLNETAVISALAKYPDAPARLYIDVFKRLDELTKLDELDAALKNETDNQALKHSAISYIGMAGMTLFLPRIEGELQNPEMEMRIQALKAILHLQYMNSPSALAPFFQSTAWPERMFAAQIAGKLQLSRYKETLSELLGDPVWWVRYSSAEALTQFAEGDIVLTHLAESHPDRYARDMANQWKTSLLGSEL